MKFARITKVYFPKEEILNGLPEDEKAEFVYKFQSEATTPETQLEMIGGQALAHPLSNPLGVLCGIFHAYPLMDYHPALLVQSGTTYTNQGQQGLQPVSVYNLQLEPIADQLITVASLAALDNSGDCEILRYAAVLVLLDRHEGRKPRL